MFETHCDTCGGCLIPSAGSLHGVSVIACWLVSTSVLTDNMDLTSCCEWPASSWFMFTVFPPTSKGMVQQCSIVHLKLPVILCNFVVHLIHMHLDFHEAALVILPEHVFRAFLSDPLIHIYT